MLPGGSRIGGVGVKALAEPVSAGDRGLSDVLALAWPESRGFGFPKFEARPHGFGLALAGFGLKAKKPRPSQKAPRPKPETSLRGLVGLKPHEPREKNKQRERVSSNSADGKSLGSAPEPRPSHGRSSPFFESRFGIKRENNMQTPRYGTSVPENLRILHMPASYMASVNSQV
ncbi:hypothetical protein FB451DRAFT_1180132 [Mycena latifolia]|nr:hypothetical protein FB451DRAFT_1180132 [Mycena latifolia]